MQAPEPDTSRRELLVHCRMDGVIVTEGLRFEAQGAPWLASRKIELDGPAAASQSTIVFGQMIRWDSNGRETQVRAYSAQGEPIDLTIQVPRAYLHGAPSDDARSGAYLVHGDKVRALARQKQWMRIAYSGNGRPIDKWINIAAFIAPATPSAQSDTP